MGLFVIQLRLYQSESLEAIASNCAAGIMRQVVHLPTAAGKTIIFASLMDWMKKHADTVIVVGAIATSMLWMNGKFNQIEKDVAIIKAVLVMKEILPKELATDTEQ